MFFLPLNVTCDHGQMGSAYCVNAIADTPFYGTFWIELIDLAGRAPFDVLHDIRDPMLGIQARQQMNVIGHASKRNDLH